MPAVLRLLLPLVAALTLLAQPLTSWASSGIVGDTRCCCPDPDACVCHDHAGDSHREPKMRRCGSEPVKLVAPVLLIATPPAAPPIFVARRALVAPPYLIAALPRGSAERPEKPPS